MNKIDFLKKIESLSLDKSRYCIIASGSMLMHGLREEVADVDIRVTKDLFQELMNQYSMKQSSRYDYVYELDEETDVNCQNFDSNLIEFVEGYPVEKLEVQLQWMLQNNRPKDQEKIKIIQDYLQSKK